MFEILDIDIWFYGIYGIYRDCKNKGEHLVAQEALEVMFLATP